MKRVLVTGSDSEIGQEWQMSSPDDTVQYFFLSSEEVNLTSSRSLSKAIDTYQADIVVNLIHYDNRNEEKFPFLNYAKSIRDAVESKGSLLLHLSSDRVLGSSQVMISEEADCLEDEYALAEKILSGYSECCILRIPSTLLCNGEKDLLEILFQRAQKNSTLECIVDSAISVITLNETCIALEKIIASFERGIFHFACSGMCTEYSIAEEAFKLSSLAVKLVGISKEKRRATKDFPEMRILDTMKFQQRFRYIPSHWKWSLVSIISKRKKFPVKVGDKVVLGDITGIIVSLDWELQTVWIADIDTLDTVIELKFEDLTQL